jgi:hypothetical protein
MWIPFLVLERKHDRCGDSDLIDDLGDVEHVLNQLVSTRGGTKISSPG